MMVFLTLSSLIFNKDYFILLGRMLEESNEKEFKDIVKSITAETQSS
jgi:hypothetical protein